MVTIEVRRVGVGDIDLLMEWRMEVLHEVFSIPDGMPTGDLEESNRRYYADQLADGGHVACLAYLDGEAVGCGGMCIQREMPSPDNPGGMCAYLMNIYARPENRRHGVGEAVVRWLVDTAEDMGIGKIYLETSVAGRPLYETMGFTDMPDMMRVPRNDRGRTV